MMLAENARVLSPAGSRRAGPHQQCCCKSRVDGKSPGDHHPHSLPGKRSIGVCEKSPLKRQFNQISHIRNDTYRWYSSLDCRSTRPPLEPLFGAKAGKKLAKFAAETPERVHRITVRTIAFRGFTPNVFVVASDKIKVIGPLQPTN
jgi:hypothetical protein